MSTDILPVESALTALLADGHSRTRATELVIEGAVEDARDAPTIVLVEGLSDQIAVEIVARRRGRDLREEGIAVLPMGGATNIGRFVELFGPHGRDARLAGLYDAAEEDHIARRLEQAGVGRALDRGRLEALGFFVCVIDLEDEFIRSLGLGAVERILDSEGRLASFRTMQNEPFHRGREPDRQLHRFIGSRKYRYARLLAEAVDLAHVPLPLDALLTYV